MGVGSLSFGVCTHILLISAYSGEHHLLLFRSLQRCDIHVHVLIRVREEAQLARSGRQLRERSLASTTARLVLKITAIQWSLRRSGSLGAVWFVDLDSPSRT